MTNTTRYNLKDDMDTYNTRSEEQARNRVNPTDMNRNGQKNPGRDQNSGRPADNTDQSSPE